MDATTYALHYLTARRPRTELAVRRSRESILGGKKRIREVEVSSAAVDFEAPSHDETRVSFEDGRRIVHVPASFVPPQLKERDEVGERKTRRSPRNRI